MIGTQDGHWFALDTQRTDGRIGYEFWHDDRLVASGTVTYDGRTKDEAMDQAMDLFYEMYGDRK